MMVQEEVMAVGMKMGDAVFWEDEDTSVREVLGESGMLTTKEGR